MSKVMSLEQAVAMIPDNATVGVGAVSYTHLDVYKRQIKGAAYAAFYIRYDDSFSCRWDMENVRLGNIRYVTTDGNFLSAFYVIRRFWLFTENRILPRWYFSKGSCVWEAGLNDVYGVWLQCSRSGKYKDY